MLTEQISLLIPKIKNTETVVSAGRVLVDWLSQNIAPSYLVIDDQLMTATGQTNNVKILQWLQTAKNWQSVEQATIRDGVLYIPIRFGGMLQGILLVDSDDTNVVHALSLADILSSHLEDLITSRLTHRVQELTLEIALSESVEDILRIASENIPEIFNVKNAIIFKFEPDDLRGEVIAEYPTKVSLGRDMGLHDYTRFSEIFNKHPIIISEGDDVNITPQNMKFALRAGGLQQYISVPMYVGGHIIGSLTSGLTVPMAQRPITPHEQNLFQMIAQVIGTTYVTVRRMQRSTALDDSLFRQLIDKTNVAIDISNQKGEVVYRNNAWNDLFAVKPDTEKMIHDRFIEAEKNLLEDSIYPRSSSSQGWVGYATMKRDDETEFDAHVSVIALHDKHDRIVGYSTITDDVTDMHHIMDALQQQTSRLSAASTISEAIISHQKLDHLLAHVTQLICIHFECERVQVLSLTPDRSKVVCLITGTSNGLIRTEWNGVARPLAGNGITRQVIASRKGYVINDVNQSNTITVSEFAGNAQSEVGVLLKAADEILGVLCIQNQTPDAFEPDDIDVLQSIADQLAMAIHNNRLFDELRDRVQDMTAMSEVSLLVKATFDVDKLFKRVFDAAQRVNKNGFFAIALVNEAQTHMEIVTSYDAQTKKMIRPFEGEDILVQLIERGAPVFWGNHEERQATASYFDIEGQDLPPSYLGLPLIAKDRVLGAIYTQSDFEGKFDENDLQFMLTLANSTAFAIENMQLLADAKERVREMEIINLISHTLSQTFGSESMWESIIDQTSELFPRGLVTIALYQRQKRSLIRPDKDSSSAIIPLPPSDLAGLVINSGIMVHFEDIHSADDRLSQLGINPEKYAKGILRSWVGTPLKNRMNENIGVICLESDKKNAFRDRDISMLETVAAQISLALDNVRLLEAEQERHKIATSLIDMGRVVTSTLDIDAVFERILEQLVKVIAYDRVAILMPDPNQVDVTSMAIHAVDGFDSGVVKQRLHFSENSPIAHVYKSKQPILIDSVSENSHLWEAQPRLLKDHSVGAWIGVPMVVQSKVVGLISIDNQEHFHYTDDDVQTIFALARQAAIAVENAHLHSEAEQTLLIIEERARRLAFMHHIATVVSSALAQDNVLQKAAELLVDLFQIDHAGIVVIDRNELHAYLRAEYPDTGLVDKVLFYHNTEAYIKMIHMVRTGNPVHITQENVTHILGNVGTVSRDNFDKTGAKSTLLAPLIAYDHIVGSIGIDSYDPKREFTPDELDTFMTIASQIAIAIRNADLYTEAIEANHLKSEFLANVSHELRTPLNAIIGYSELLLGNTYGELNDKQMNRLERVYRSGRHLLELINDILDLSKIESGKLNLEMVQVDIEMIIRDALESVQPQIEAKSLDLMLNIESGLPHIRADNHRLQQIIVNLLSNAVKFTHKGFVRVGARLMAMKDLPVDRIPAKIRNQGGIWLLVSVRDSGIGINEDDLEIIFDAFRQADGSSIREYEGTGLGLAITKRLIEMHNGHIWVDSTPDEGSTFYLMFPTNIKTSFASLPDRDSERSLVLAIDDDEATLRLIEDYVSSDNYQVITTSDSSYMIELAQRLRPDVIITDLIMPQMDGWQLLESLKNSEHTRDIPVIIISVMDRKRDGLSKGAEAFLTKPINRHSLLSALSTLNTTDMS